MAHRFQVFGPDRRPHAIVMAPVRRLAPAVLANARASGMHLFGSTIPGTASLLNEAAPCISVRSMLLPDRLLL